MTNSASQSRKWQLIIGMSQWCCSVLCGHPLPALTDNWTHGAASRHTIAPISHTSPSPRSRSYYYILCGGILHTVRMGLQQPTRIPSFQRRQYIQLSLGERESPDGRRNVSFPQLCSQGQNQGQGLRSEAKAFQHTARDKLRYTVRLTAS